MNRLIWLFTLFLLVGCQSAVNGQRWADTDSAVVFRIGSRLLTLADVNAEVRRAIGDGIANALAAGQTREQIEQIVVENDLRRQIFEQMIQNELLLHYARQHGIGVDPLRSMQQSSTVWQPMPVRLKYRICVVCWPVSRLFLK